MTTVAQRKKQKRLSPRNAKTLGQLNNLRSNTALFKWGWLNVHTATVTICEQRSGDDARQNISIPRREFNRMVDWYLKEQECRPQEFPAWKR